MARQSGGWQAGCTWAACTGSGGVGAGGRDPAMLGNHLRCLGCALRAQCVACLRYCAPVKVVETSTLWLTPPHSPNSLLETASLSIGSEEPAMALPRVSFLSRECILPRETLRNNGLGRSLRRLPRACYNAMFRVSGAKAKRNNGGSLQAARPWRAVQCWHVAPAPQWQAPAPADAARAEAAAS